MSVLRLFGVGAPTADGVRLATDISLPSGVGRFAAIVVRTPYSRLNERVNAWSAFFADYGYVFVAQDVRGRGDSEGVWEAWINEFTDGRDAIEWVAAQLWCDGKVGTLGGSYEAWVQWAVATLHPQHLSAMVTSGSPGRWFRDWPYRFGAFYASDYLPWLNWTAGRVVQPTPFSNWAFVVAHNDLRSLDTDSGRRLDTWQEALDHDTYDEYWHSLDIGGYEGINAPRLHITGWYDACATGELHHFREMRTRSPAGDRQWLILGPWDHHGAVVNGAPVQGDREISSKGSVPIESMWEAFFARWLKGEVTGAEQPIVRYFCLGANEWMNACRWPPESWTDFRLYPESVGTLDRIAEPECSNREFTYDPLNPVLSLPNLHNQARLEWGPRPAALIAGRADVLVYSAAPSSASLTVAGPVHVVLFASTTGVDTDFVASLIYVRADGTGTIMADGIVRAAFRASLEARELLEPGRTYEFDIEVGDVCLRLDAGESLQLAISSSLAPNYHPNPNTGLGYPGTAAPIDVRQTLFQGGACPSRLHLHVLDDAYTHAI
jgi:putative CocE/NonD family hydrolase